MNIPECPPEYACTWSQAPFVGPEDYAVWAAVIAVLIVAIVVGFAIETWISHR